MAGFAVRVVCAACNNGWMSDLEGRVEHVLTPMVAGHSMTLPPTAQLDVALWTAMKAFVVKFALNAEGEIVASADDRRALMDAQHPRGAVPARIAAVERDGTPNSVRRVVYTVRSEGAAQRACRVYDLHLGMRCSASVVRPGHHDRLDPGESAATGSCSDPTAVLAACVVAPFGGLGCGVTCPIREANSGYGSTVDHGADGIHSRRC